MLEDSYKCNLVIKIIIVAKNIGNVIVINTRIKAAHSDIILISLLI